MTEIEFIPGIWNLYKVPDVLCYIVVSHQCREDKCMETRAPEFYFSLPLSSAIWPWACHLIPLNRRLPSVNGAHYILLDG